MNVSAGQTISYSIGNGGKCNVDGTLYAQETGNIFGDVAAPGGNGAILVEWGDGIQ